MKKAIIYLSSFILLGILIYFGFRREDTNNEIITVSEAYSLTSDQSLYVKLYFLNKNHIITNKNAIYNINLNNDEIKLALDLDVIEEIDFEYYLNNKYYVYKYKFQIPSVEEQLIVNNAKLEIILENGIKYNLNIGKISIQPNIESNSFNWTKLEGRRLDYIIYPRIGVVYIDFIKLNGHIKKVDYGFNNECIFQINDNILTIYIKEEKYLLEAFCLNIYLDNDEIVQIPYFKYMITNNVLKEAGPLLNIYND